MSRWLVIGDTSFTGKHFVGFLSIDQQQQVTGVSLRNLDAEEAILDGGWDYIVNFAALNVVPPSWDHPMDYLETNVIQQCFLFDAMVKHPPKKYCHISTPEVYGSTTGKVDEWQRFNPSTPYATSRAAAEFLLRNYVARHHLPAVVTRACNVYGPGQQLYRLIPRVIHAILSGKRFPLEGGGASTRAFLHVDDCCRAIHWITVNGWATGNAWHISTYERHQIREVVQIVCDLMDVKPGDVIVDMPPRAGQDQDYHLDWHKLEREGWEPKIELRDGIEETIKWMEDNWDELKNAPLTYEFRP
jgi:dTDP-glucose 4,6-dehydratase